MGYIVKAPLVQAKTVDGGFVHVYEGGFLPDDPDPDQLAQLLAGEMVAEADAPPPPEDDKPAPAKRAAPTKAAAKRSRRRAAK